MNNNTIEPRLIALLNDAIYGPPSSSPSLELPPLHDPNILKASGRPLLLEPDASQGNGAQATKSQLSSKHNSSILSIDEDNEKAHKNANSKSKSGSHVRERALGGSSPQSLRKILDDDSERPAALPVKKRQNGASNMDDFLKLPQPPPKKQKTVKQVVPPIIIGLFQPPEPPSQAALFPPIASSSFHDSHGRNTLNTVPPRTKAPKEIPPPDPSSDVEKSKEDIVPEPRKRRINRTRKKWSEEETNNLLLGVAKYGIGCWKEILEDQTFRFNARSAIDLKDRFRTCCPPELRGTVPKPSKTILLETESGNKTEAKLQSKSSLMSENILISDNDIGLGTNEASLEKISKEGIKRSHQKKLDKVAHLGIDGPFRGSERRQRRPFTEEEDRSILQGYSTYGPSWRKIQLDEKLNLQSRSATDIRDRYRNKVLGGGKSKISDKVQTESSVVTSSQNSMTTLTQEFDARVIETPGKDNSIPSSQDSTSLQAFSSRDGLRIQEIISSEQETPRMSSLQHQNAFGFKDNFNFPDASAMDSSDNLPFSQSFDWSSGIPAPFSSNIGEMDISRLLLDDTPWPEISNTNGKEKQSFTDINSILTTSAEPLHTGPSYYNMLNDPIDEMNEGSFE
jgi:hypothetical protein